MPIIFQSGSSSTGNGETTTVQQILNCTSQDVRQVLNPNTGVTQVGDTTLLTDYINRISLELLRFSRWTFLESAPQVFITQQGVTDYYIGAGGQPIGTANTALSLSDVQFIKEDAVYNRSTNKVLFRTDNPPLSYNLQLAQRPLLWRYDPTTPDTLNIYPIPDGNSQQRNIIPGGPVLTFAPGGSLPQRTYYLKSAFQDSLGGIGLPSVENSITIPANNLLTFHSPILEIEGCSGITSVTTSQQVTIASWNVYASAATNTETLQSSAIAIGTDWTEPTSGLVNTGAAPLGSSTLALLGGYLIEFRYFQARQPLVNLSDLLQIPDVYRDVVCAGVNWLAYKYLKKDDEAQIWKSVYDRGKIEMVKDKNLFPREDFVHPDPASIVRAWRNGVGLDSGIETSIP